MKFVSVFVSYTRNKRHHQDNEGIQFACKIRAGKAFVFFVTISSLMLKKSTPLVQLVVEKSFSPCAINL